MTSNPNSNPNSDSNLNNLKKLSPLQIGDYTVHAIPTGLFGLDGGAMFGTVPKVLWQKSNPADEQNRIQMEARALLLCSKQRNILIDTGNGGDFIAKYGDKLGSKFSEIYAVKDSGASGGESKLSLVQSIQRHGLQPNEITDVILTHLHFDHAGGATTVRNGRLAPTFPKAQYHVQRKNLETAQQPNLRERASYFSANFTPLIEANVLNLIDGDKENYFPNVSLRVSNGHTLAQQVVLIEDSKTTLIYCADLIPTSSHIRSAWVMGYDLNPLLLIEEKQKLLKSKLADPGRTTYLYFEHDPYCDLASYQMKNDDFQVGEKFII